jgi:hypothetical protein
MLKNTHCLSALLTVGGPRGWFMISAAVFQTEHHSSGLMTPASLPLPLSAAHSTDLYGGLVDRSSYVAQSQSTREARNLARRFYTESCKHRSSVSPSAAARFPPSANGTLGLLAASAILLAES